MGPKVAEAPLAKTPATVPPQQSAPQAAQPTQKKEYVLPPPKTTARKGIPKSGIFLIIGLAKSGKNSFALSKPGLFLIETERKGSEHLTGRWDEARNLRDFSMMFRAALEDPTCNSIGISTFDKLLGWWSDYLMAKYNATSMSDNIPGVNLWGELRKIVDEFIDTCKENNKLILILAHHKEPKLDRDGKLVIQNNVDAPGKIGPILCHEAEMIGRTFKSKVGSALQYKITFGAGDGEIGAYGGRVRELEGKEVVLPVEGQQWASVEAAVEDYYKQKEEQGAK